MMWGWTRLTWSSVMKEELESLIYIRLTLTDDITDLAIGLILAALRRICEADRFVKNGFWKNDGVQLSVKVCSFFPLSPLHLYLSTLNFSQT